MTDPKDATVHDVTGEALPKRELEPGMLVTERVQLVRPLGRGGMADVWLADHLTLGIDVAVKFVRDIDTPLMRQRLSQEARLAARIVHPHGVQIYDQGVTPDGTPFMVMERVEGEPLVRWLKRVGPLPLHDVVRLVEQVAQVLTEAHGLGILHRDIKPHNIMLVADHDELFVKVLDFGLAKPKDPEEDLTSTAVGAVVGTPVYMAPEQLIDHIPSDERSDLWGLAVVAYEALTGERPFRGPGRAALGAAIMLRKYERLSKLMIGAPAALEAWFERALAVDPDARFQTATELAASFEEAATDSLVGDRRADEQGTLRLSKELYGREGELRELRAAFDRAAAGALEVMTIAGYAGIGKTALVRTFLSGLGSRRALCLGGKFDQFDGGTPYVALRQAFRHLGEFVGGLPSAEVAAWRDRLLRHVGDLGGVVTEMVPELEGFLGPQLAVEELPPPQQRERFLRAITQLLVGTAAPSEPLVIFLDDLQWADLPSLELLGRLGAHPELRHTLIIGAYRDHEVEPGHPLRATLEALKECVTTVPLGPLDEDAVLELLYDTFGRLPGRVRLAIACHGQTRGNPFFLRRLLEALFEEGILAFEEDGWRWDAEALQARPVTDNVVDFVADEIRRMARPSKHALAVAACIGDHFDLGLLAHALETDRSQALQGLRDGLAAALIVPSATGDWDQGPLALTLGARHIVFRFTHDRVRQAARSLLDDEAAAEVHERIGRFMMESLGSAERERRLFELVEHLNRGQANDRPGAMRALNLSAARRATRSAAFAPAAEYYRTAHAHIARDAWETSYDETLAIHVEGARAAYLDHDEVRMNELLDVAVARAETVLDRVAAREVRIQAMVSGQRLQDAIALSFEVLGELGAELPLRPTQEETAAVIRRVVARLDGEAADVETMAMASDPRAAAVMRIAHGVLSACYLTAPELVPIVTCHMVEATLDHGLTDTSGYGFAVLGLVLNATGATSLAYRTGALALALADRAEHRAAQPKTEHVVRTHINAFVEPVSAALEPERRVFQRAMDVGDLEFAGWALHTSVGYGFYAGTPLDELADIAERNLSLLRHHRQRPPLVCTAQYGQLIRNLRGEAADPRRLVGPEYDEDVVMASMRAANVRGAAFILGFLGAFARYLFGAPAAARDCAEACAAFEDGALSTYHQIWFQQLYALAIMAAGADDAGRERVASCMQRLRGWRDASPVNLDLRICLVEAELARVEGRDGDALTQYDRAIAEAASHGFLIEEAMGNELASRFHLGRGARTPARAYAQEARACFERWGATAKVEQLDRGLLVDIG